jgi:bifunctional non-homologous end joining protein LigD
VFKPSGVLPAGFVAPCLPTKAAEPPSGGLWLHEIQHDGFRVIARKDGDAVRLYSRPGNDLTYRFPQIVQALASLRSRSCVIDGEAVACRDDGVASFDRLRYRRDDANVFLVEHDMRRRAHGTPDGLNNCLTIESTYRSADQCGEREDRSQEITESERSEMRERVDREVRVAA